MKPEYSPDSGRLARFAADLDALVEPGERLGVAVSGGPDSVALLLLAAAARPGLIEAATVDHGLRPESRAEAETVAALCERLGVGHAILAPDWPEPPRSGLQEKARDARYAALGRWLADRGLAVLLTGHHRQDQAETLLMRLNRGSGVRGVAAMRASAALPGGSGGLLLRPLLGWGRDELAEICAAAGVAPLADSSNVDDRFERVRIRKAIAQAGWLDAEALARSAAHLAAADAALDWAADLHRAASVTEVEGAVRYCPNDAPPEIRRRVVGHILARLASEAVGEAPRGRDIDRLIAVLEGGGTSTLRGVKCSGGGDWRFAAAPPRR